MIGQLFDASTLLQPFSVMSSRLCVKGFPRHVTEKELREHFKEKGVLTDVKIIRTKDGRSRQFGFIGFKTTEEAEEAQTFFDKTFLGTSKLSVEFARPAGDNQLARPWSKYSKGSSAFDKIHGVPEKPVNEEQKRKRQPEHANEKGPEEEDPELQEFLALMQPRSKAKTWANDDPSLLKSSTEAPDEPSAKRNRKESESGGNRQENIDRNAEESAQEDALMSDSEQDGSDDDKSGPGTGNEAVSDLDYLRSRMNKDFDKWSDDSEPLVEMVDDDNDDDNDVDSANSGQSSSELEEIEQDAENASDGISLDGNENQKSHNEAQKANAILENTDNVEEAALDVEGNAKEDSGTLTDASPVEMVKRTKRLFLRNLPFDATETDIIDLFGEFGDIVEAHVAVDKKKNRSKGFGYVLYADSDAALNALNEMDGHIFQGRLMHVLPAELPPKPKSDSENPEAVNTVGGGYKSERMAKQKEDAGNRAAWNTLFMRADTVAEAVAEHYGVSKADLMDRDASDLGVRMALGETQVIAKTKESLGDAGVNVNQLEEAATASGKASSSTSVARSNTVVLIKNLPFNTSTEELAELFGAAGKIVRLVLPPTKVLALVEYADSENAKTAFRTLAYKKYHAVPIYLEWAPKSIFTGPPGEAVPQKSKNDADDGDVSMSDSGSESEEQEQQEAEVEEDEVEAPTCTLYVKNLAFTTTEGMLSKHFDRVSSEVGGHLRAVRVARKKRTDGKSVSAGYGFVELDRIDVLKHVMKKLQGSLLDGRKIELQRSMKKQQDGQQAPQASTKKHKKTEVAKSTKLMVRNLAFEATKKDVVGLFSPFGHIKSCRLPKKFDGSHRGFAFVDFVTKQEAKNAMEGVTGAHLYGRRLVIEYAKADDTLDELRAKTAAKFQAD